jgi:hypothetical protein
VTILDPFHPQLDAVLTSVKILARIIRTGPQETSSNNRQQDKKEQKKLETRATE